MSTNISIFIIGFISFIIISKIFSILATRLFDKYFQIILEENYNLDDLFPIKISGQIIPKADFLEIPYNNLSVQINTQRIRGTIISNRISLELIKIGDRKKAIYLVKKHYTKAVKPYIRETFQSKMEHIRLIKISKRQRPRMKKIACNTCKHKMQCQIAFKGCNYERKTQDSVLDKGLVVNSNKNYELDYFNS